MYSVRQAAPDKSALLSISDTVLLTVSFLRPLMTFRCLHGLQWSLLWHFLNSYLADVTQISQYLKVRFGVFATLREVGYCRHCTSNQNIANAK